jgi:hypothetical protein
MLDNKGTVPQSSIQYSRCVKKLREQYKLTKKEAPTKQLQEYRLLDYQAIRLFCLECELLTFNTIERIEYEVNNEVK